MSGEHDEKQSPEVPAVCEAPEVVRPIVAIVGRPNVGKSTLFNRIAGRRLAIVEDIPGVTRDRNYADAEYDGKAFTVVDTGGFLPETEDHLMSRVRDQARLAIDEAQAVILVVDGMSGLTAADQAIAGILRKGGKPTFVAVNKIDSAKREEEQFFTDFFRLGIEHTFAVSAEHARGVGQMMEELVKGFPAAEAFQAGAEVAGRPCRVAIVGRPNVGKSSLINALLGEERFVASEVPGTTTDPLDARLEFKGQKFILTDTAGLRRKRSIAQKVEQFSVMHALSTVGRADVVVVVLDATEPAVDQDLRIAGLAVEKGKAVVVFVNKWDLVADKSKQAEIREELKIQLPFVSWAPVVFGSAKTGDHVQAVLTKAGEVYQHFRAKLPTPILNDFLAKTTDDHPPPLSPDNKNVRLYYIAQVGIAPPTFTITCNRPESLATDYRRYLVNRMRDAFGLKVPVVLLIREKPGKSKRKGRRR